jgi:D-alanine-D-alanine ligase
MTADEYFKDHPSPIKIAVLCAEAKREYFLTEEHFKSEAEALERAELVSRHLRKLGHLSEVILGNSDLVDNLKIFRPDMVINMVDSIYGKEYLSSSIPGTLEMLKIPYTGSGILGQSINSNKYLTKSLLEQYGITTPKYQLITHPSDEIEEALDYPLIVKLNEVHGAVGIAEDSVCFDKKQLNKQIKHLFTTYDQPLLVEEFIVGREVTVIIVEGGVIKLYGGEKIFNKQTENEFSKMVTYDDNWDEELDTISYQKYDLPNRVKEQVRQLYAILKMEDYAKVDLRVDQSGRHYIIDANSNPALGPAGLCAIGTVLEMYDVNFNEVLSRLIYNTLNLYDH